MTLQTIGAYTVLHRICHTASSEVVMAVDPRRGQVALKVVLPQLVRDKRVLRQYRHEAEISERFDHPNLIKVHEFVEKAERPYMVMKYVAGRTLKTVIYRDPELVLQQGFRWLARAAQALGHMHRRGYVHLDVKPENIMVEENGGAVVLDLALARRSGHLGLLERLGRWFGGEMFGTRSYMSPEQIRGERLGPPTDIYSLGVVVFEAFARRLPLTASDPRAILRLHLTTRPPMLHHVIREIHPELSGLVSRMLEKDPSDRPQAMDEVIDTLVKIGRPLAS